MLSPDGQLKFTTGRAVPCWQPARGRGRRRGLAAAFPLLPSAGRGDGGPGLAGAPTGAGHPLPAHGTLGCRPQAQQNPQNPQLLAEPKPLLQWGDARAVVPAQTKRFCSNIGENPQSSVPRHCTQLVLQHPPRQELHKESPDFLRFSGLKLCVSFDKGDVWAGKLQRKLKIKPHPFLKRSKPAMMVVDS